MQWLCTSVVFTPLLIISLLWGVKTVEITQDSKKEAATSTILHMPDRPDKALLSPADLRESRKIVGLHFSADGKRLVTCTNWGFVLWDLDTAKILHQSSLNVLVAAVASDAQLIFTAAPKVAPSTVDMRTGIVKKET